MGLERPDETSVVVPLCFFPQSVVSGDHGDQRRGEGGACLHGNILSINPRGELKSKQRKGPVGVCPFETCFLNSCLKFGFSSSASLKNSHTGKKQKNKIMSRLSPKIKLKTKIKALHIYINKFWGDFLSGSPHSLHARVSHGSVFLVT